MIKPLQDNKFKTYIDKNIIRKGYTSYLLC